MSDLTSFTPIPDPTKRRSARFTAEEDNLLKELVKDKKNKTWKEIANFLPGRTACQCRDRYNQYLFKEVVNKPWSSEEDEIIIEKYKIFGPHWVKISQFLPGRSGNNIKNRWNSALTKYHGISHQESKQERRSKRVKWGEEDGKVDEEQEKPHTHLPLLPAFIEPPAISSMLFKQAPSKPNVLDLEFPLSSKKLFC
ncbi:Myb-like DNA-binding domain containing protein [Trichomonas vaginalis G3]|uniref:Myb-like DNA-binding domain containing protein n=1 Tax=Trichomonas vaginalis (strain ATCC PRA-98 / G3) TaxID=412133 RepID=A2FEL3_TRIV3|nr:RNA polymerase II transcription regulator recruiting protein [Trichomonas vaginalis G3]EAX96642.1 Myb-like DNA-binding domain containing protein [Trichomonas vaginalis G3]KAI5499905.1 RNA polymerase II transcription regulator recruiting protein [Trichomonas vaginalis G3]|eukprot:XP_001309572.1 Myb-like DNA-binding domain containing protein [Trichomonas vaginalis G3]